MHVTIPLKGERGAKYRIVTTQMGRDVGGGILWELQRWREAHRWHTIASGRESTNDASARILAGWLTTPMPLKDLGELFDEEEARRAEAYRGEINPLGGL